MLVKHLNELNPKEFNIGQIVFYLEPDNATWGFGKVIDYYSDGYGLGLYEPVDDRLVDDIPIAHYPFGMKKLLPKKWSYDTKLFEIGHDETIVQKRIEELKNYREVTPENIQHHIDVGLLVKPSTQNLTHCVYDEINDDKTYSIVLKEIKHPKTDYVCVNTHCVFATLDEVLDIINKNKAEKERKANLSNYDYSVEEMDNVLNRYERIYQISHDKILDIRKELMDIIGKTPDGIVDIRIYQKKIQYIAGNGGKTWKTLDM